MTDTQAQVDRDTQAMNGLRVLVLGLGRFGGGVGVARWLADQGAVVTVTDRASRESLLASVEALAGVDITFHLGGHDPCDLDTADLVVVNPAVRKTDSVLFQEVVRRGVPWTTEINLFCERCPATVIGVTGTYGKSTTCAMLAAALKASHSAGGAAYTGVHLGGNIGRSLLTELDTIRAGDLVVLEMSSAQLEDLPRIAWAPRAAVITNLSPHHMDRYETYDQYVKAKLNIIGNTRQDGRVFVGEVDAEAERILRRTVDSSRLARVSRPCPPLALRLPGDHNQADAACALAVCHHLGLRESVAREAILSFTGLPHRLEYVRTLHGVDYYNDSKSTSPAATLTAIAALDGPIVAIVGGQKADRKPVPAPRGHAVRPDWRAENGEPATEPRELDLHTWATRLVHACRVVICLGETGPSFARAIRTAEVETGSRRQGTRAANSKVREVDALAEAVRIARTEAAEGDVVLFSPGAPSFDMYSNFTQRGRHFIEIVKSMS